MPIKYCSRCGAWSTRRAFNLAKECPRTPTAAGRQALARIARGRHPWLAIGQRAGDRGYIQTAVVAENCARGGEARHDRQQPGGGGGDVPMPPGSSSDGQAPVADDVAHIRRRDADAMDVVEAGQGLVSPGQTEANNNTTAGGTVRAHGTRVDVTAADADQRLRTAPAQAAPRPTREQIHHRLLQSLAEETARKAAKRGAMHHADERRLTPVQRICEVRERCLRRKAAQPEMPPSNGSPRGGAAAGADTQSHMPVSPRAPQAAQGARDHANDLRADGMDTDVILREPEAMIKARQQPRATHAPSGNADIAAHDNPRPIQHAERNAAARDDGDGQRGDAMEQRTIKKPRFYDSEPRRRLLFDLAGHGLGEGRGATPSSSAGGAAATPSRPPSEEAPMAEAVDYRRPPEQDLRPHAQGSHRPLPPRVHGPLPRVEDPRVRVLGREGHVRADHPAPHGALGPPRLHAAGTWEEEPADVSMALGSDGCSGQSVHPDRANGSPTRGHTEALGSDGGGLPSVQSDGARGGGRTGMEDSRAAPTLRGGLALRHDQEGPARRRSPPPPRDWPAAKRFRGDDGASRKDDGVTVEPTWNSTPSPPMFAAPRRGHPARQGPLRLGPKTSSTTRDGNSSRACLPRTAVAGLRLKRRELLLAPCAPRRGRPPPPLATLLGRSTLQPTRGQRVQAEHGLSTCWC